MAEAAIGMLEAGCEVGSDVYALALIAKVYILHG